MQKVPFPECEGTVALLVGDFDPPTLSTFLSLDVIWGSARFQGVWLCPLASPDPERTRALVQVSCLEYGADRNRVVTACSIGLDKEIATATELVDAIRNQYPFMTFRSIMASKEASDFEPDCVICFGSDPPTGRSDVMRVNTPRFSRRQAQEAIRAGKAQCVVPAMTLDFANRKHFFKFSDT